MKVEVTEKSDGHVFVIVARWNRLLIAKNEITFSLVDFMGKYDLHEIRKSWRKKIKLEWPTRDMD